MISVATVVQFTKEITDSIVGQTVGRIVVGAQDATPDNIRDGIIGCVKVSVIFHVGLLLLCECDVLILYFCEMCLLFSKRTST